MFEIDWQQLQTEELTIEAIALVIKSYGLSGAVFSHTPLVRLPNGKPGPIKQAMSINFDRKVVDDWIKYQGSEDPERYSEINQAYDPVRRKMINQILPKHFVMSELVSNSSSPLNAIGDRWVKALIAAGVREIYSFPIFSSRNEYWSLAAFKFDNNPNIEALSESAICELYWLATKLADHTSNVLGWTIGANENISQSLSKRELECLVWASKGKTASETAMLLKLAPETVRKYLKTSIRKLEASNITQAVCNAHYLGHLNIEVG